jgi:hypothetical protein
VEEKGRVGDGGGRRRMGDGAVWVMGLAGSRELNCWCRFQMSEVEFGRRREPVDKPLKQLPAIPTTLPKRSIQLGNATPL